MIKIAQRLAIFLIMACLSLTAVAQEQRFYGKVLDERTHAGISDANISFSGTKSGCITNQNGEFSINLDELPAYMIVSHLGYKTRQISLDKSPDSFNILLEPVVSLLQEVEIKAVNKPEPFFKDNHYSILDYEVDNNLVYLLIFRFRLAKSELLCKSSSGDTIAHSGILSFKPTGLFLDCLGRVHVLSQDSAYQVYLHHDSLTLLYPNHIQKFKSTISDCVASTDDWLIFRKESYDHRTVDFSRINRKTSLKEHFATARDEEKMKMLRQNPSDYRFLLSDKIPDGNANLIEYAWINKVLYKPATSVLHRIGDTIAVFNTTDGKIDLYDLNGKHISGTKISIREKGEGDWSKEIYLDHITHLPYTSFLRNGKVTLYQIDVNTGGLKGAVTVAHIFPRKIRIHNNSFYYLYDLPGVSDNKHLFSQKTGN